MSSPLKNSSQCVKDLINIGRSLVKACGDDVCVYCFEKVFVVVGRIPHPPHVLFIHN